MKHAFAASASTGLSRKRVQAKVHEWVFIMSVFLIFKGYLMKSIVFFPLFAILIALTFRGGVFAAEKPSQEKGHLLFNSQSLAGATSTKSCASCHPKGSGLQNAWQNPDLATQINTCIAGTLKGIKLNVNSVEMQSLIMYIRSLKQ